MSKPWLEVAEITVMATWLEMKMKMIEISRKRW